MKNVTLSMMAGLMVVASVATASAASSEVMSSGSNAGYGQRLPESARDFMASYKEGRPYSVGHKALHNGFDPNGDGVHPEIGPITD